MGRNISESMGWRSLAIAACLFATTAVLFGLIGFWPAWIAVAAVVPNVALGLWNRYRARAAY